MAGSLLYLEMRATTIAALRLERSGKVATVTACAAVAMADRPLAEAVAELRDLVGGGGGQCRLSLGPEFFMFRNLFLPFAGRKQIAQVLPFELAEQIPLAIDGLFFDFLLAGSGEKGSEILAAILPRELLAERLAALTEAGFQVDSVGLAGLAIVRLLAGAASPFLLVDAAGPWVTLFMGHVGRLSLIRCLPRSPSRELLPALRQTLLVWADTAAVDLTALSVQITAGCDRELQAVLAEALPGSTPAEFRVSAQPLLKFAAVARAGYRPEEFESLLAHGLGRGDKGLSLELLPKELRRRRLSPRQRRLMAWATVPLSIALLLFAGYLGQDYLAKVSREEQLRQEITAVYRETIPGATRIVNPLQQLQVINNELRRAYRPGGHSPAGTTAVQLLSELSARIPETVAVRLNRLVADGESVRLAGVTGDFNTVDTVQKELEKSPLFQGVTISSASQSFQDDEIRFELKLNMVGR